MEQLSLITVKETAERKVFASGAELTVCISGQAFFTGTEALKKAAEVNRCVEAMKDCGIEQGDISIQNVSIQVESGILTKSSSAAYHIAVRCKSLDCLGPVLAAIASQKNTRLVQLLWVFETLEKAKEELLQTAVEKAKVTAQSIAGLLGTECSAIHKLSYEFQGADQLGFGGNMSAYDGIKGKRAFREASLKQLNLEHNSKLEAVVSAVFVVAPFRRSRE